MTKKTRAHRLVAAAAAVAIGAALAGCSSSTGGQSAPDGGDESGGLTTVRMAFTPGVGSFHQHIAEEMGFYEEHGIDAQVTEGLDLPTWVTALDSQYDVVMTTAGIFLSGADTFDLTTISGMAENGEDVPENVVITRGGKITDAGDLAGARIGTSTITGTTPLSIQYLVQQAGGDPASVTFVQVPPELQADQLRAGQIDAVVSRNPWYLGLLADDENELLFQNVQYTAGQEIDPGSPAPPLTFYVSSTTWANEHPEAAQGIRAALQEAIDWIAANEDDARAELAKWLQLDDAVAQEAPLLGMTSTVTAAQIQPVLDLSIDQGIIAKDMAPDLKARVTAGE